MMMIYLFIHRRKMQLFYQCTQGLFFGSFSILIFESEPVCTTLQLIY